MIRSVPIRVQLSGGELRPLPDARQRLLLRAALLDDADAHSAWRQWRRAGGDIDSVDMPTFRLLPLLYRNLDAGGIDDPDLPRLKGVYRHAWATNQRLLHRVGPALRLLHAQAIPTMALKGAAVSVAHYRDGGARPMDDVDVLVPADAARRALAVLLDNGWSLRARIDPERLLRSAHATKLIEPGGAQIDLHWRVHQEWPHDEDFWVHALPMQVGGAPAVVPGPAHQLMHTCAHGVMVRPAPLRWLADAAVILRTSGDALDWEQFEHAVAARPIVLRVATALAVLRECVGADIPTEMLDRLAGLPVTRLERTVHTLTLHPIPGDRYLQFWHWHRSLANAGAHQSVPPGFLQYVADLEQVASRRALGARIVRRVLALASPSRRRHPSGSQDASTM